MKFKICQFHVSVSTSPECTLFMDEFESMFGLLQENNKFMCSFEKFYVAGVLFTDFRQSLVKAQGGRFLEQAYSTLRLMSITTRTRYCPNCFIRPPSGTSAP